MSTRPDSEAPPLPQPAAGLPNWTFIDDGMIQGPFGPTAAQRWRSVGMMVLMSVDWRPMPRGWYYHLSVTVGDGTSPPSDDAVARAARAFGLVDPEKLVGQTSTNIVHLYARVPS